MLADSKNYDWLVTEDFIRNIKNVKDAAETELGKFSKRGGVISGIGWLIDLCTLLGSIKFQIFSKSTSDTYRHGEALGPSGENYESRWSVNRNIGHFTPLFENDKNRNIW